MSPHSLTNFEAQKYYQNEPSLKCVYSKNNLPKINDEAYVINLDKCKLIGTHWIPLYVNCGNGRGSYDTTYFDSIGAEHIPKETKKFIGNKNIKINIYSRKAYNLKLCGYKSLFDYTNLYSSNEYEIISKY